MYVWEEGRTFSERGKKKVECFIQNMDGQRERENSRKRGLVKRLLGGSSFVSLVFVFGRRRK